MKTKLFLVIILNMISVFICRAQLENDSLTLNVIEIKAERIYRVPYMANKITNIQIQSIPTRDIGDFLRTIPNVSGVRKGGAALDPVVRGFKFSALNVIIDNGIKIENGCPNRMDPTSSHVEVEDIEKIDVIKGPYIMKYGPSLGGVINLNLEKPRPYDKFQIHADALYGFESNWNGQKEHISIFGGNKNVYFLVSGGYREYGNYKSGDINGTDTTIKSAFKKFEYAAKLGFTFLKNQEVILSYYDIHSRDVMYPSLNMDDSIDDTRILSIDYSWKKISKTFKTIDVKIYQTNLHHVMDNSKRPQWAEKQMIAGVTAISTGVKTESLMEFKKSKMLIGADYDNINKDGERIGITLNNGNFVGSKKASLWREAIIQNTGIYAEYTTFFSKYELSASIRGDFNTATSKDTLVVAKAGVNYFTDYNSKFTNLSASIGLTRKFGQLCSVSLSIGRGTRSPNMLERYIKLLAIGFDNYDYLGNPQLKPETNNEIDLTFRYASYNIGSFYVNGFYSYVKDYITSYRLPNGVVTPQTMGVLGVKQFINTDYVTFRGFEFGYNSSEKYKIGGSIIAAYTYAVTPSATKYTGSGNLLTSQVINNDAITEIPPFEATFNVYYKFLKGNLVPKLSLRVVSDQNHVSQAFYEKNTSGFSTLSFSAKYTVNKFAKVNAGITNIFNNGYYEHLNRNIVGSSSELYEPGRVFYITLYLNI